MPVGSYRGRIARKLNRTKGFLDWSYELGEDNTTPVKPKRIARVYDGEEIAQALDNRIQLWRGSWMVSPEHGVLYATADETGHLDRKQGITRHALKADLIQQSLVDRRITELLSTPDPVFDENRRATVDIDGITMANERIRRFIDLGEI